MKEQDVQPSLVFQGGSLVSRIRLQESVERLVMNVTYGRSSGESLASLDRSGLWLKMYGDCYQAKLDGSFEEYSEILPTWGTMLSGVLFQPPQSEQYTGEKGWRLLPTPTTMDAADRLYRSLRKSSNGKKHAITLSQRVYRILGERINPLFVENMMGFPIGWTELEHLETP